MSGDPQTVTQMLGALARGDRQAAADLLPLVYAELRRIARSRMNKLPPGQTLQATALVHEAYLRLVGSTDPGWDGRRHFFAAAARAMRDIVVEQARRRGAVKRGGDQKRVDVAEAEVAIEDPGEDILALDEALTRLEAEDPRKAQLVMLRHFAGFSREEIAEVLDITTRTVDREWRYIIAWLHKELTRDTVGAAALLRPGQAGGDSRPAGESGHAA